MAGGDPVYPGFPVGPGTPTPCSADPSAPTCSIFLPTNTYFNNNPPCSEPWVNEDFPVPDAFDRSIIYDVMLPAALGVPSCKLSKIIAWAHIEGIGVPARLVSMTSWFNNPGTTTPVQQGSWTIGDVIVDTLVPLTPDETWIATVAEPTHLQFKIGDLSHATVPFVWGAGVWSNEWCGIVATPSKLATIVG